VVHELDFADVHGLVDAYEVVAQAGSVQSCEIDLDRMQLTFTTRFPLAPETRDALNQSPGLLRARCWPAPAPVFSFADAVAAAAPPGAAQSAIDFSTSITATSPSTG
jgi:hypothetical protein